MGLPNPANFKAHYNLDEAAGNNAIDATGNGYTMAETSGTIGASNGGRDIERDDSEYFYLADPFYLQDWTIGGWVQPESLSTNMGILTKVKTGTNDREWALYFDESDNRYKGLISSGGTSSVYVLANNYGAVSSGVKVFAVLRHDSTANELGISINAGSTDTVSHSSGTYNGSAAIMLGAIDVGGVTWYLDAIVWSHFIYDGVMTDSEISSMFNSGTPLKWSDITGEATTFRPKTFITFRDLDLPWLKKSGIWQPKNLGLITA